MSSPLAGYRVALAEGRQLEELADLLTREGAVPLRYPLLSILDAPDAGPVDAWLRELAAGRFALVVFLTGEGVRRLVGFAERAGLRDGFVAGLRGARLVVRGPKPVKELKALGLTPHAVAQPPTTDGVVAALRVEPLSGATVGVQLYAPDNPTLLGFLAGSGIAAQTVLPYVYAPASDADRVVELIDRAAGGSVDAIIFTSSPQVDRLFEVAEQTGRSAADALARVTVAAVGPVVANALARRGVPAAVCPPQGFVMKNLIQQLLRYVESRPQG